MSASVAIVGAGIHPFGRHEDLDPKDMVVIAARAALADAGVSWEDIDFAVGGTAAAGLASNLIDALGLTGVPFFNSYNGCATAGSSLIMAKLAIESGRHSLALVVGFDKHPRGALSRDPGFYGLEPWYARTGMMVTPQYFALKAKRYLHEFEISTASLAKAARRAFANGSMNENAWRRQPLTEADILSATMVADPLTQYMLCSPGAGAVAVVLSSAAAAARYSEAPVYLRAAEMRTRKHGTFEVFSRSFPSQVTASPSVEAAAAAFRAAELSPSDMDVIQVQDTDAGSELIHLAECGFCEPGEQEELMRSDATAIDGPLPVNTDGGCLANGEPIGASGLRQLYEIVLQLRGRAGQRQVPGRPAYGFTHVYGAPGVSACTVTSTER